MKSIFAPKNHQGRNLNGLVDGLTSIMNATGTRSFVDTSLSQGVISLESADPAMVQRVENSVRQLRTSMESVLSDLKIANESINEHAGIMAGMLTGDITSVMRTQQAMPASTETHQVILSSAGVPRLKQALEAYDEKENRQAAVYSVAYNMQAARQDEFGETLFPTVVVTQEQAGFTISIHLVQVYDEVRRQTSGALDQFNRKNIVHAVRDPSILNNDSTNIVPVVRTESADKFVAAADVAPKTVTVGSEQVETAPLLFGKKFSLLGISQTDALLATGLMDNTDSIDTSVSLDTIYLKLSGSVGGTAVTEVIAFQTKRLPLAVFNYSVQANYRQMVLNFTTNSLVVDKTTKTVTGAASQLLAPITTGDYVVHLSVDVNGTVNLETADTGLMAGQVTVADVIGTDMIVQAPTSTAVAPIVALFDTATLIGYDIGARRTNMNRRQRGQLLDVTIYNQTYQVPLLSPITVPRPLGTGDATDSSDLAALITATRIRTSNAAVAALLDAAAALREFVTGRESVGSTTEIMGVARFLVNPVYQYLAFNAADVTQSLSSHQRADDIQSALVSALRDMAYRAYRDSGYKAFADAMKGGESEVPTVIIATDPVLARYLTVTGDLRTLGNDFKVKIVSTLNKLMTGKIFLTFGDFSSGMEGAPNPMHFGNMGWKPEMTLVLPLHRNGANSKELTVQPSFIHIVNLPILCEVDVTGISDLVLKPYEYKINNTGN